MRMVLKNRSKKEHKLSFKKFKKYFTLKNLTIFLISFAVVSIILGFIFFQFLDETAKQEIVNNIKESFTLKEEYDYFKLFLDSLFENLSYTFLVWILGISIVGIIVIIILYFFNFFSIGFTISGIFNSYGYNGIFALISYLFPSKLVYILLFYFITFFAIKFSAQLFKHLFLKQEINLQKAMKKYFNVLIFAVIITIVYSILEVFVNPFMIKIFTNFIK